MTPSEIKELRDRVRGLTGPDREVDALLCVTFQYMPAYDGVPLNLRRADDQGRDIGSIWLDYEADEDGRVVDCSDTAPALTGSIDAAVAFSEKVLPGYDYILERTNGGLTISCRMGTADPDKRVFADTLSLAIIDATLTALIETMK